MIAVNPLNPENSSATKVTVLGELLQVRAYASGGVKMLRCSTYPASALTSGITYDLCTLPDGYRPSVNLSQYLLVRQSVTGLLYISTDGLVQLTPYAAISTTQGINFVFAYL